jgi:GNAT superfamily N-acetyltransferase
MTEPEASASDIVVIRDARPDDRDTLVAFNLALALETEGKTLDPEVVTRGVAVALADPARLRYWVADRDGQVIGQAAVTPEWSDWRAAWVWWLQSVYVHADYRGSGVFKRLLAAIREAARARGDVIGLRLYVEQDKTRAQAAYRALGLHPGGYHVYEEFLVGPLAANAGKTGG